MAYLESNMHQIRFRLRLCSRPHCGRLQRSPNPLAGFQDPTSKGKRGEGRGYTREKGRGGEEREGKEGNGKEGK